MKINIITLHNIINVGSVFQAWALNEFLNSKGYDCSVIDYVPRYLYHLGLKSEIGKLLNYKSHKTRSRKYNEFVNNNIRLTEKKYYTLEELEKNPPKGDLFISGGDQLWNEFYPCGNDEAYQLKFTSKPKIAFGTSLGKDSFTDEGMNKLIKNISKYKYIGIRESSGTSMLRNEGITHCENVCDPVFLLEAEKYNKFIGKPLCKEPYLLVYLVQASPLLDKAVEIISKELNLKVILCSGLQTKTKCDIHLKNLGPEESLNYMKNATYILSGSFHATAFSIIMHKPFLTLLPGQNTNARIEDFLHFVELENRMISEVESLDNKIFNEIDWATIDAKINSHANKSKEFLINAIESIK